MGYKPERVFALLDAFYPVPKGKNLRSTPFLPYLTFVPQRAVRPSGVAGMSRWSDSGIAGGELTRAHNLPAQEPAGQSQHFQTRATAAP